MKTWHVGVGLVVLLAIASANYFSNGRKSVEESTRTDSTVTASAGGATAKANADQQHIASEQAGAASESRPVSLFARYAQSIDLFDLVSQLRADADAGDADAARVIALAYDECYPFAAENWKVLDMYRLPLDRFTEVERSIYRSHRMKAERRCAGFTATGGISFSDVKSTDAKASAMNDLTAQARQLAGAVGARQRNEDARQGLSDAEIRVAQKIALSGDAEAIANLAYSQDDQHLHEQTRLVLSPGGSTNALAWLLVACDLGRDCAADGYIMRQQCLTLGFCISGDYREYMRRRMLAPDKFADVLAREREILQAIKSGDVSQVIP